MPRTFNLRSRASNPPPWSAAWMAARSSGPSSTIMGNSTVCRWPGRSMTIAGVEDFPVLRSLLLWLPQLDQCRLIAVPPDDHDPLGPAWKVKGGRDPQPGRSDRLVGQSPAMQVAHNVHVFGAPQPLLCVRQ